MIRQYRIHIILPTILIELGLYGWLVYSYQYPRPQGKKDSWAVSPPNLEYEEKQNKWVGWDSLLNNAIIVVPDSQAGEAEKILTTTTCRILTWEKAEILSGRPLSKSQKVNPYLVRGVYYSKNGDSNAGFSLSLNKQKELWVNQTSLGPYHQDMKRNPIIAFLPFKPTRIYVESYIFG